MDTSESRSLPQPGTRLRVPEHVLMRSLGDEMVMLNLDAESYYGLNEVGARLMQLAETGATLEQIAEQLFSEFEVGREQLEQDVRKVAADLMAAGLLVEVAAV
jgi:hypothetical protein